MRACNEDNNFQKGKIVINKQQELYENSTLCYICKEKSEDKYIKDKKNIVKSEIIFIIQVNAEVLYIVYVI